MSRAATALQRVIRLRLIWVLTLLVMVLQPVAGVSQTPPAAPSVDATGAIVPATRPDAAVSGDGVSGGGVPGGGVPGGGTPATRPASGGGVSGGGVSGGATPGGASATAAPGALDYVAWEATAVRAEAATANGDTTDEALEFLRGQLVDWREALLGAQNANAARIATLRTQIAALGAVPAEGETEAEEIATRRSELTQQLVRLQAPGIAAEEAYRRADGLIREIDRVLRERQANELLQLWPAPINPTNWTAGLGAFSQLAVGLWDETDARLAGTAARAELVDNLPLILLLIAFAIVVLWRGRGVIDAQVGRLLRHATARGARIWSFLASLGLIVVPMLGVIALSLALELTGVLGEMGLRLAQTLPIIAFPFFAALWLGGRVFPVHTSAQDNTPLIEERRAEGRILTTSFGALVSVDALRIVAFEPLRLSDAAVSVLSFPVIVVAGLLLFRIGQVLLRQAQASTMPDGPAFQERMIGFLGRAAMVVGAAGPVLAAVGYVPAAQAMIYPAALSLGLVGLLFVVQRLIGDIHALVMRLDEADHDGLVPVLAGFLLTLATLPLFALIWGARWDDLTELWTRFREGFMLGDTRVSPTDFLMFAVIFGFGYALTRVLQGALKASVLPRTGLDQGGQTAVVSGLGYVGIFLAGLVAINSTGIDLSGLAIVAGALSVGIGFGLQNIVSNFVSGIILLIERPVSEGDWIEVGTTQGIVKSISVRSTRIQTFDRNDVIVPNTDLVAGRVTNWTRYNLTGRLIVPVTVPFTTDSRKVERLLREIAEAQPMAILNPPPLVVLMGFTAETLQFEIRVILRDVNFNLSVRSEINHQIAERFAAEDIFLTNAHRDFVQKQADLAAGLALEEAELRAHERAVTALLGPLPADADEFPDPLRPGLGPHTPDETDHSPEVPRG